MIEYSDRKAFVTVSFFERRERSENRDLFG